MIYSNWMRRNLDTLDFRTLFPESHSTEDIADLCYDPQFLFHLTGSCEDNVSAPEDVDLFIPDSTSLEKYLRSLGFVPVNAYRNDPFFTRVFEREGEIKIHVQAVKPELFMAKWQIDREVHELIRAIPFEASKRERKEIYDRLVVAFWIGTHYEQ